MTEIRTERLLLRPWRDEDLEPYARICADSEVMSYLPAALSREESAEQMARFVRHWEELGYGLWAVEQRASGEFIGFVALMYQDEWPEGEHKTEVGWRLGRDHWGRSLATEGALASVRYGFEGLGLERIISITLPENAASRRVMEKCGLILQGEMRWRGHDVVWYAIDCDAWEARG